MNEHVHPMQWIWRLVFGFLAALGGLAFACGLLELAGVSLQGTSFAFKSQQERWTALAFGALAVVFTVSALWHSRLTLSRDELRFLRFNLVCHDGTVPLASIQRFGHGLVRRAKGRVDHMLLLELTEGGTRKITLSLYARHQQIPAVLGEYLGREPAPTEVTWRGLRFAETASD